MQTTDKLTYLLFPNKYIPIIVNIQNPLIIHTDRLQLLPGAHGKTVIMYQRYSFSYCGAKRLRCSRYLRGGCQVRLSLTDDGRVAQVLRSHNHEPPNYHKTSEGVYHKVG